MQKISDVYAKQANVRPVFSFEFFPPKNPEGEERLYRTIQELEGIRPDFVSVTYGAGGSTRAKTLEWVKHIQDKNGIIAMAHYTCVGSGRMEIRKHMEELYTAGIRNIMALRGDPPKDGVFSPPADGFRHADELITFIRSTGLDFCLGGACYPEKHPEASSMEEDLTRLAFKVRSGAGFLVSQLFFRNDLFLDFVGRCRRAGINVPIVPGIMPITQFAQIERFTQMTGCSIPQDLVDNLKGAGDDREKLMKISLEFSIRQCRELIAAGCPGIHFYTLNQSHATMEILKALR